MAETMCAAALLLCATSAGHGSALGHLDSGDVGCREFRTRAPAVGETPIDGAPMLIDRPGRYVLVKDIEAEAGAIAVCIADVTIDLNGHTLTYGSENRPTTGGGVITYNSRQKGNVGHSAVVCPVRPDMTEDFGNAFRWHARLERVVLRNGRIVQGRGKGLAYSPAVNLSGTMGAEIHDLLVEVSAPDTECVITGRNARLHHCTFVHRGTVVSNRHQQCAVVVSGGGTEVSHCEIDGGPQVGVKVLSGSTVHDNLIRQRATVTNCYGVQGYGQRDVKVYRNRIIPHNGRGVHLSEKSSNWEVYDNYIEVRETKNREYRRMQTHGIKLEGTRNSRVYGNTVLAVSAEGGEPTPLNISVRPDSGNSIHDNTFVAVRTNEENAYSLFVPGTNARGADLRDNAFYTNHWAVKIDDDGGENLLFRRFRFHKLDRADKVRFIAFTNYRGAPAREIKFVDCVFADGIDPRDHRFPPKGAAWRTDGQYAVGWSLSVVVTDGHMPAAGAGVLVADRSGRQVAGGETDERGEFSADLVEYEFRYEAAEENVVEVRPGPYTVSVASGARSRRFSVNIQAPVRATVNLAGGAPVRVRPVEVTPVTNAAKPFWRERVRRALGERL